MQDKFNHVKHEFYSNNILTGMHAKSRLQLECVLAVLKMYTAFCESQKM